MAYPCRLCVPLQKPCLVPKSTVRRKTMMLQQSQLQLQIKKVEVPQPQQKQIRFSPKNKIFEDPSQGIVCYTDDDGEMVCEGYDEGPRCLPHNSTVACYSREAEILDLLQRSYYLQLMDAQKDQRSPQQGLMMIKWSCFKLL